MAGGPLDQGAVRLRIWRRRCRACSGLRPELLEVPAAGRPGQDVQHFDMAGRFGPGGQLLPEGFGQGRDVVSREGQEGSGHHASSCCAWPAGGGVGVAGFDLAQKESVRCGRCLSVQV